MIGMDNRTPKENLLIEGLYDWVYASWVYGITSLTEVTMPDERRALSLRLISELLTEGLMVPGDIDDGEHRPWLCSTAEAIERIRHEWLTEWPAADPDLGAIVWLANTEKGDEIARAVLARESEEM